jgi:hypothetical protein
MPSIIFFLGLLMVSVSLVANSVQRKSGDVRKLEQRSSAEYAAFSGLQVALFELEKLSGWSGTPAFIAMPNQSGFGYKVSVTSNLSGSSDITHSDGTLIPPHMIYLRSTSQADSKDSVVLSAMAFQKKGATFSYPGFGSDSVDVGPGSIVDSVDASGTPVAGKGSLRTNGKTNGVVHLGAGATVDGDITVGSEADPINAIAADVGSSFSGQAFQAGSDLTIKNPPDFTDPSASDAVPIEIFLPIPIPMTPLSFYIRYAVYSPGSYRNLVLGTASPPPGPGFLIQDLNVMMPGDYHVQNFKTQGGVVQVVASTAKVNFSNSVQTNAAATALLSSDPKSLQLYGVGSTSTIDLNNVAGALVALGANSQITLNNAQILGAVAGKSVNLNSSKLTYPTSLDSEVLNDSIVGRWDMTAVQRVK